MNDSLDFDPASLSSLATSTPKPSSLSSDRKSGRRSWFEKPSGITYSIAVENKEKHDSRRKSDVEVETLVLTHFTTSPKIGFGTCKLGIPKQRTLIVKNPHDYPQSVKIERVPHKNIFSFDSTEFTVDGESIHHLEISFNPENEGNFREMIQFSIDNAYRLQAFVFGTCQKPQKKKIVTRKGLLNQKVKRPLSVVYTQSLANIAKSYSPDKSEKDSARVKSLRKDENRLQTSGNVSIKREKSGKRNHRRSNTYNSSDQGEKQDKSQERSQESIALGVDKDTDENKENQGKTPATNSGNGEQRSYVDDQSSDHQQTIVEETCTNVISPDTFLKNSSGLAVGNGESGLLENCTDTPSTITASKGYISPNTFLQESSGHQKTVAAETCTNVISPDTFLKKSSMQGVGNGESGFSENCTDTPSTITATKGYISPNTFLQDLNETKENLSVNLDQDHSSSVDDVLNKSVPHEVMLSQLEFVKTNLKWKMSNSLCLNGSKEVSMSKTIEERALTFVTSNQPSNPFSIIPEGSSPRRTTYTVKRKHSPRKTMTKVMQRRVAHDKTTVNHSKDGHGKNVKQPLQGRGKAPKRRRSGSFTPRGVWKNKSSLHLTGNVGKSPLIEPTPERMVKERHAFDIPDSICLTPEILEKSKNPNRLPGNEPSNLVLPTPERILMDGRKESNAKTPLSHHYRSLTLLTPEQSLQKMGPKETGVDTPCSKQTFFLDSYTSDKGSLTYLPDTPLQQAHAGSETNLKEESVLTQLEVQPSVCLFTPSGENGQRNSDSLCISEISEGSFNCTPLPTSPNPDLSRRSTHIIHNPRVLNSSHMEKKRLFPPLDGLDNEDDEELEDKENIPPRQMSPDTDNVCGKSPLKEQVFSVEDKEEDDRNSEVDQCSRLETISTLSDCINDPSKSMDSYEQSCKENVLKVSEVKEIAEKDDYDKTCLKPDNCTGKTVTESCVSRDANLVPLKQGLLKESKLKKAKGVGVFENQSEKSKVIKQQEISKRGQVSQKQKTDEAGMKQPKVTAPVQRQTAKPKTARTAKSKLILMKRTKTALPKHPLPFASKNIYYDERWMEKQERGFSHWLNFILTPSTEMGNNTKCKVDASKLDFYKTGPHKLAPTKEALSFKEYSASRKLNGLRRSACKLFQSEAVTTVVRKLEMEVESHRLMIRKDRKIQADLGLRQSILDLLLSFNPLWLRIGLETVFGEIISVRDNGDVVGLSHFIITRILGNPDIACQFAHPSVPHLYKEGYSEAIAQHFLKKFLLLVYFLDQAKCQLLIKHDPCLFCMDSEFKSCKALLVEFSSHFLAGEGDINRHLGYLGCLTSHTQTALDEFDYAIQNLSTDLRDGLRLIRILDLLEEKAPFKRKLRVPAISRLQKIHNMDVAFSILKDIGIDMEKDVKMVSSRDIVDGHKEKTLHLLWMIILKYQIGLMLNANQLKDEISALERSLQLRKHLQALKNYEMGLQQKRRESTCDDLYSNNELLALLLKWCRTVCLFYGLKVENFTVSFSDGQALCFLVHHYHPDLLPQTLISTRTSMTYQEEAEHQTLDCSLSDSPAPMSAVSADQDVFKDLLKNERENFKVLHQKVSELGGVPMMIKAADMSNTIPDEKIVVTYISYLCARLLDIREECRAARTIQLAWRRHYLNRARAKLQVKEKAAIKIQRFFKCHQRKMLQRKQHTSAIIIQRCVRRYLARRKLCQMLVEKRLRAARVLKNFLLTRVERQRFVRMKASAIKIQCVVRGFLVRQQLAKEKSAVGLIENWYLSSKQSKQLREKFLHKKQCIITIQRAVRKLRERRKLEIEKAAVVLQKTWRAYYVRCWYKRTKSSIAVIQRAVQAWKQRKEFLSKRKAVLFLQQKYRAQQLAKSQRATFLQIRSSSIVIQQAWRRHMEKRSQAVTKLQSYWRGFMALRKYTAVRKGVVALQAAFRAYSARKLYLSQHRAANTIQQRWKEILMGRQIRQRFLALKAAVITIQAIFKGHQVRKQFLQTRCAVIVLQKNFRRFVAYKKFQLMKESIVKIQRKWRATLHMKQEFTQYQVVKGSVLAVQSYFRGYRVRKAIAVIRQREASAQLIQKYWRGYCIRKKYLTQKECAKTIQTAYRAWKQKREKEQKCKAVIILQRRYRAILCTRLHRKSFLQAKSACCTIQKHWRMKVMKRNHAAIAIQSQWKAHAARKRFRVIKKSVIYIQSAYRMWKSRKNYMLNNRAAVIIQQRYREYRRGMAQRESFLISKGAALTIQAYYRGYQARKRFRTLKGSAIKIQAHVRGYGERKKFQLLKESIVKIQRKWRSTQLMKQELTQYQTIKQSVLTVQSYFRGYRVRKAIGVVRQREAAAQLIQKNWRGYCVRKNYLTLRKCTKIIQTAYRAWKLRKEKEKKCQAAVILQRRYRALLCTRLHRESFLQVKSACSTIQKHWRMKVMKRNHAAIVIQSQWRAYAARNRFRDIKNSVISIQSAYRMWKSRKNYMLKKKAAVIIQQRYREYRRVRAQRENFLISKGAALTIQAYYRGYQARKRFRMLKNTIIKIQAHFRVLQERKKYMSLKTAALTIQKRFRETLRARRERMYFLLQKGAAIYIQARYKAYVARKQFINVRSAVVRLQSAVRTYLQKKRYKDIRDRVCTIQRKWRATLMMKDARLQFMMVKGAAVTIQAFYKKCQAQREFQKAKTSVIKLQSLIRRHLVQKEYTRIKQAACVIQRRFREYMDLKQTQEEYLILKGAVITIQACFRGYLERRQYLKKRAAVVMLQSGVRKFLCQRYYARLRRTVLQIQRQFRQKMCVARAREKFLITKGAAISIQAHYRSHLQQREYRRKRQAVIKLQAFCRMKIHRGLFLIQKMSACTIQRWFRNKLQVDRVRTEFQRKRQAVILLQSATRGWIARKQAKQRKMSIIHIQALVRKFMAVQKFQTLKKYTKFCQQRYRAKLNGRAVRSRFLVLCQAAITIQSCYRGLQIRRLMMLKQESARRIQSWYRGRKQCILYQKLRHSVLVCQKTYRTGRQAQSDRRKFLVLKGAALTIQASYKVYRTRCMYQRMRQEVILLQAGVRGFLVRKRQRKLNQAASIIQRGFRKHLHRELLKRQEKERQDYLLQFAQRMKIHMAATIIQRCYRKHVSLCHAKKQLQSVLMIQNWMKGRICRLRFLKLKRSVLVIERASLKWIQIKHDRERQQAATMLQAVWRGRQVRMRNKCKKVARVRQRVVEAQRSATDDKKLGNRTESALDYLLQYKQLSHLLEALVHLDVATRLSPACCERLVEVNAVSVIYTLISSCNRSQPHMEVIKMAVSILLNLAKYDRTLPYVFMDEALNILLDLMQIYREKGLIFNRTCTLVGILGRDECRRKIILSQPRVTERLQSLYKLTARKYKLHENQQMRQAKLNASKAMNYTLPIRATPHKLPKIRPDWVLHRGSLHNIDNPMQAISVVIDSLHIVRS